MTAGGGGGGREVLAMALPTCAWGERGAVVRGRSGAAPDEAMVAVEAAGALPPAAPPPHFQ